MKVKCPSLLESHLDLYGREVDGDAAARDGLDEGGPDIGTEERSGDMRVTDVEEWRREGLEGVGLLGWKVDELVPRLSV